MRIKEVKVNSEIISSYVMLVAVLITSLVYAQSSPPAERIKTIFDYKQELNLTDRQEQDIKTILTDLNKEVRITRAKLTLIEVEINDLIKQEGDLEQIRKKLKDAAEIQVALKMADIAGTRKIHKTLSPDQLKKWRELQASAAKPQK
jgi:uncharacterized membrane protein